MNKQILFQSSAVKIVLQYLRIKGYIHNNIQYINKNRYAIIKGNPNIAILLKTEPFFNFGNKFGSLGEKGVGDSINTKAIKTFIQQEVELIYTIFKDGKIYYIRLDEFIRNSHKWQQKEGTEVRSISIHHYKRVK